MFSTTGTQLLRQYVENRKMQTIHVEGKVPHFNFHLSVCQIIMGGKVAKKEEKTNVKREILQLSKISLCQIIMGNVAARQRLKFKDFAYIAKNTNFASRGVRREGLIR